MKKWFFILFVFPLSSLSQNMTNETLHNIYSSVSDSIQGNNGAWQFYIKDIPLMSITDANHNRMRIISPISDSNNLSNELIKAALVANFHTALDVKYAVSDGILWSVFIHPLKELSQEQVKDAVSQVYYANVNFGTSFASTSLTFPGRLSTDTPEKEEKEKPKFKKL
ncbi:hypothetical protein Q4Q35_05065 [Flavivirga aquimarina]|uniref:Uncharacterized protein n=1 Tax=Flavivirga aquimarina TaxID=2027862 RepID=A0ABT8W7Y5_9FLAO|nr:hypothetical protein [Flavivirga aquimarina]MDO5969172.1 hypothetical protein [Flavivirga aquimarina]